MKNLKKGDLLRLPKGHYGFRSANNPIEMHQSAETILILKKEIGV